jgi:outer membrane murein-binding lipoprotein Lpp
MKNENEYKSPRRKLVTFFEKSRNQWKEKCSEAKTKVKQLNNRVRFLEKSKEQLKNEITSLKIELTKAKAMKKIEEIEIDEQKKSS